MYDATSQTWKPGTPSGGGGSGKKYLGNANHNVSSFAEDINFTSISDDDIYWFDVQGVEYAITVGGAKYEHVMSSATFSTVSALIADYVNPMDPINIYFRADVGGGYYVSLMLSATVLSVGTDSIEIHVDNSAIQKVNGSWF